MPDHAASDLGLAAFALSYAIIAMSPGPNFMLVVQAGLSGSRRAAFAAAFGVSTGAACLALVTTLTGAALSGNSILRTIITLAFAGLLLFTGLRLIYRSLGAEPARHMGPSAPISQFALGFVTAVANPITAGFFIVTSISMGAPAAGVTLPAVVFVVASLWFALLALSTCTGTAQRAYRRCWRVIALSAGAVLVHASASALPSVLPG